MAAPPIPPLPPYTQTLGAKLRENLLFDGRPPTMASPPAIGPAATVSTLSTTYAWNSSSITGLRCNWIQVGANPRANPISVSYDGSNQTPSSGLCGGMGSYFFVSDAPLFEIDGLFDAYRVYVDEIDGKGWQTAGTLASGGTGTRYYVPVDWSGVRKFRKYRIDFGTSCQFYGIKTTASDTVYPYTRTNPIRAVLIGDSFPEGSGATYPWLDTYGVSLGFLYGIDDFWVSGSGGTGLIRTNGPRVAYAGRIQIDAISKNPDIIFVQCTQNDGLYAASDVQTALSSLVQTIRAGCSARIVIIGVWNTTGTSATAAALNTALQTTAASLGVDYWNWYTFITGTGKVTAPAGNGNADYYVSSDGTHPTTDGHIYRGERLVDLSRPYIQQWP